MVQDTKKFNCSCQIKIKEFYKFPSFKITEDTKWRRVQASKCIKDALSRNEIVGKRMFSIYFPSKSSHTGHFTGDAAGISQPIDQRLKDEIFASAGLIKNVDEMRRRLEIIVTKEIFQNNVCPIRSNKRFFPSNKIIRNYMLDAIQKKRHSNIDQECLMKKIDQWKVQNPRQKFFFQPKGKAIKYETDINEIETVKDDSDNDDDIEIVVETSGESFLFVYQSEEMQRLLKMYGNEITLLDATYKTTKYSLPLFFLVVKTNVDYQTVGTFVCKGESAVNIQKALSKIKEWNPNWNPTYLWLTVVQKRLMLLNFYIQIWIAIKL
nr:uncharacterized protein LOC105847166 isoform X2 [Hydra vulgaris]